MAIEQQDHPLSDGGTMTIYRDGNHRYWTNEDTTKRPSVTTLIGHVSGDTFGAGVGWATKQTKLHNDPDAPRAVGEQARKEGEQLHKDISDFIDTSGGAIAETPAFNAWHRTMGNLIFLASEQFVYHPTLKYGGTLDQIALDGDKIIIQDVKSVDPESWAKYGSNYRKGKDWAQVAAYITALNKQAMNSKYQALYAQIVYVMRDGSGVAIEDVDLSLGFFLFRASMELYELNKELGK